MGIPTEQWSKVESFVTNKPLEGQSIEKLDYIGGIVGGEEPSHYSRSPVLWNRFFETLGINAFFTAFDLPEERQFTPFTKTVLTVPGCIDLTVTSPYKNTAFKSLSSLAIKMTVTERVHHLGCLNHIIVNPATGEAFVDNTDGQGMIRALKKRCSLNGTRVVLVGAGGAASSIGYEIVREGADLIIANIIEEDASRLAERLKPYRKLSRNITAGGWDLIRHEAPSSDIIISAISNSAPLDRAGVENLPDGCLLADTRYGVKGEFVEVARKAGHTCVDGREMLYGQFMRAAEIAGSFLHISQQTLDNALGSIEEWFLDQ